jgi:monosaccharide-transporting ATPase
MNQLVFISSELEEVKRVSDRIAVLRDRKKVAEYSNDVDDATIIHTMAGEA